MNRARSQRGNVERNYYERIGRIESRMDHVEGTLSAVLSELKDIGTSLRTKPREFDPLGVMKFVALAIEIVASAGAAITYVATSTNAGRLSVIEFQTNQMWKTGHWTPYGGPGSTVAKSSRSE